MSAADRNGRIQSLLVQMVTEVRSSSAPSEPLPAARRQQIGKICSAKAQGYREVLLTVIVAWLDGIKFDPCGGDFYECKPRAIFEQGVRPGLVALGLKSRKSGPLNVAKAQTRLDASWAASRDDAVTAGLVAGGLGGELSGEPEGCLWIRQHDCGPRPQWVHLTYGQIPVHPAIVVLNARRLIM